MNESDISIYLLSHAPLDRFYLFMPGGNDDVLLKYFDSAGKSWILMEDDDEIIRCAVKFLKESGTVSFGDHGALVAYERRQGMPGISELKS